jgi:hypothetical protein
VGHFAAKERGASKAIFAGLRQLIKDFDVLNSL